MSYAILYRNVSQRLKQLDERVSKFERGIEEDQLEWDKVRQDLVSVTRLASNLENLTDQDDTKLYKQYSRWSVTRGMLLNFN